MSDTEYSAVRRGFAGKAQQDRETLCPAAKMFRETILQGFGDAFIGPISEEQLEEAKTRLVALAEQAERTLWPAHFPSIGGSHVCVAQVKQEFLLRLQSRLKVGLPEPTEPIVPTPSPTLEEQADDLVRIIEKRSEEEEKEVNYD